MALNSSLFSYVNLKGSACFWEHQEQQWCGAVAKVGSGHQGLEQSGAVGRSLLSCQTKLCHKDSKCFSELQTPHWQLGAVVHSTACAVVAVAVAEPSLPAGGGLGRAALVLGCGSVWCQCLG